MSIEDYPARIIFIARISRPDVRSIFAHTHQQRLSFTRFVHCMVNAHAHAAGLPQQVVDVLGPKKVRFHFREILVALNPLCSGVFGNRASLGRVVRVRHNAFVGLKINPREKGK